MARRTTTRAQTAPRRRRASPEAPPQVWMHSSMHLPEDCPEPPCTDLAQADVLRRQARIAEAAYQRAERRGFEPGHEVEDWLAAEAEVDAGPAKPSA